MIWQQFQGLIGSYPLALRGLGMTVALSLISLVLGTLIGGRLHHQCPGEGAGSSQYGLRASQSAP
jgi:ABC-type amino acid transport system permease subunit